MYQLKKLRILVCLHEFFNVFSVKDPAKRLGGGPTDAKEIKGHAFFENISWDELEQKKV